MVTAMQHYLRKSNCGVSDSTLLPNSVQPYPNALAAPQSGRYASGVNGSLGGGSSLETVAHDRAQGALLL